MDTRVQQRLLRAARLAGSGRLGEAASAFGKAMATLPTGTASLKEAARAYKLPGLVAGVAGPAARRKTLPSLPAGARFLSLEHSGEAGARAYRLYVPASLRGPAPLVVMLHGCTQDAVDFALGTRMNEAAEARGCLVAWPEQSARANAQRCWNWFEPADQRRDGGEPAVLAGIIRDIVAAYPVDPRRIYVAGLSAGGAAAAVMGQAYPELIAAVGVHSGLPCGAAHDAASAFAAMHRGSRGVRPGKVEVPTIVFHGDADPTVSPVNADAVAEQALAGRAGADEVSHGQVPGGHAWQRARQDGGAVEVWRVRGAGHAWSGGDPAGSFTDRLGPDATGEMLRFFLEHPRA